MARLSIAYRSFWISDNLRGSIFRSLVSATHHQQRQQLISTTGRTASINSILERARRNSSSSSSRGRRRRRSKGAEVVDDRIQPYSVVASRTETAAATKGGAKLKMASDDDYMAFLNKANSDADKAHATKALETGAASGAAFKALDAGEQAPRAVVDVCRTAEYTSDADEPFEPVALRWAGKDGLPDEEEFAKLIKHWDVAKAEISILDPLDWDAEGEYTDVIEAVRQASRGNDVRVYRVARDETRVEYWVITRDGDRIVGAKALAIES